MSTENPLPIPNLLWDWGTAYDLFASLQVLHYPKYFGVRGSWAAGVRSRLPTKQRKILEAAQELVSTPIVWIYHLPPPKDAAAALWTLSQIPPAERLPALAITLNTSQEMAETLRNVAERGAWNDQDMELLRSAYSHKGKTVRPKVLARSLDWWSQAEEFGERFLEALQAYQSAFFVEEERRIQSVLQESLEKSQQLAQDLDFIALIENLSRGLQIAALSELPELVLVPSYWTTPLVIYERVAPERMLMLYGARPQDVALVPGEVVPDAMLNALKALADPTRLRVLRYLAHEPLTPSQLSRRLRLRAPTVIHHLNALRLAGLVHLSLGAEDEKRYAMRAETVGDTFEALQKFLTADDEG